jgi:hypothetical protein
MYKAGITGGPLIWNLSDRHGRRAEARPPQPADPEVFHWLAFGHNRTAGWPFRVTARSIPILLVGDG